MRFLRANDKSPVGARHPHVRAGGNDQRCIPKGTRISAMAPKSTREGACAPPESGCSPAGRRFFRESGLHLPDEFPVRLAQPVQRGFNRLLIDQQPDLPATGDGGIRWRRGHHRIGRAFGSFRDEILEGDHGSLDPYFQSTIPNQLRLQPAIDEWREGRPQNRDGDQRDAEHVDARRADDKRPVGGFLMRDEIAVLTGS